MQLKRFSVFDLKAEAFLPPFYAQTTGLAIRMFESAASDQNHDFHKYATDYTLFELGTFDQAKGVSEDLPAPVNLGLAASYARGGATVTVRDETDSA